MSPEADMIGDAFVRARNRNEAMVASQAAITFITTNSNSINNPLRLGHGSPRLEALKNAIDYGIQKSPDYGTERNVDRRVDFSPEFLQQIFQDGILTDPAFASTTANQEDPSADFLLRNTLLHIKARWATEVANLSPNSHFQEHLLLSGSRCRLIRGHIEKRRDDDDHMYSQPVKAELWLEQIEPEQNQIVADPWTIRR